ncbi:MAG: hypothetical protein WC511_05040 [Candidatus Pacearchaeota archaeon]|jgi:hypothetical protein
MLSKEILEDLAKDCPCNLNAWCFFRDWVLSGGLDDRMAEQVRLMYDYKYLLSREKDDGTDVGKDFAFMDFSLKGYTKKFAEIYKPGMKNDELFELMFGFKKQHTEDDYWKFKKSA